MKYILSLPLVLLFLFDAANAADFATPPMPGEFKGQPGPIIKPYFWTPPMPPAFNGNPGPVRNPITPAMSGAVQPLFQVEPGVFIDRSLQGRVKN